MTRTEIVAEARTWLGTPWRHQGRLKRVGVDCIGLVGCVALGAGVEAARAWMADPAYHNYGPQPSPRLMLRGADRFMDRVGVADVADVLMLRFEREPMHFALVTGLEPLYVIHALAAVGKVAEHRVDPLWTSRIVRAYRFRGI